MAWNTARQQGRYEVIFKDRALHDATTARAQRAGMSVADYLQSLARAVVAMEQGDPILLSLLGVPVTGQPADARAGSAPTPAPARDTRLIDSALDQFGL